MHITSHGDRYRRPTLAAASNLKMLFSNGRQEGDEDGRSHARLAEAREVLVADRWQGTGLGTELMSRLIDLARDEKISRIVAHILSDNRAMLRLAERFHFKISLDEDPAERLAILETAPHR